MKSFCKKTLPIVLFLIGTSGYIQATHLVGGELSYTCLGNNFFEINMKVYRDCINGVPYFDDPASIGLFNASNTLISDLRVHVIEDDTVDLYVNNPCLTVPSNVCFHVATYSETVYLPPQSGGYTFVYQRCCRNGTISNVTRPDSTGVTYYIYISEEAIQNCNNSPVYADYPPNPICVSSSLNFDNSAQDVEGDSIVYSLCKPLDGAQSWGNYGCTPQPCGVRPQPPYAPPYDTAIIASPFKLENLTNWPLSTPPIAIDSQSGLLTGLPNLLGQFVIGVCMEEYRNGVLYSQSNRDFQYSIVNCNSNGFAIDFTAQYDTIQPGLVYFSNNTTSTPSDPIISHYWDFGDGVTSTVTNPSHVFNSNANYLVSLTSTTQSGCSYTHSVFIQFIVPPWADFTYTESNNVFYFQNNSLFSSSFRWDFGDGVLSTEVNPIHQFVGNSTEYEVKLIAENGVGTDTFIASILAPTSTEDFVTEEINVYPNPIVNDRLYIDMNGNSIFSNSP